MDNIKKDSIILRAMKKEYLKEHLEKVEEMVEDWINEMNAPSPFALKNGIWGWQTVYRPSSEQDPDIKHTLKHHLRSRVMWNHHTTWEEKLLSAWNLIVEVHKDANKEFDKLTGKKNETYIEDYLNTALWRSFEIACGRDLKLNYAISKNDGVISFGAYRITNPIPSMKKGETYQKEHLDFSNQLASMKPMKDLALLWKDIEDIQASMRAIATKIIKSKDILHPCRFCRHLWRPS